MRTLQDWLAEYGESHQHPTNKKIHWLCVPAILLSLIGLSWQLSTILTLVLCSLMLLFFVRLSMPMVLALGLLLLLMLSLVAVLPVGAGFYLAVFVLAWIGQFYGHKLEGKKPSFFKDLQFLLIGPAWCVAALLPKIAPSIAPS